MNSESVIRVLIVDDHPIVRDGLRGLIATESGMALVGEAADGAEAVRLARSLRPDVILLDLVMPGMDGLTACKEIKAHDPGARVLILTSFAQDDQIFMAIKSGAMGYLLKDSSPPELLKAIRDVHRGEASLHPTIARKLIREIGRSSDLPPTEEPLTEREVEVLRSIAQGLSNREISAKLVISERTVGNYVSNLLSKLHLANRTQAALYALRSGMATLEGD